MCASSVPDANGAHGTHGIPSLLVSLSPITSSHIPFFTLFHLPFIPNPAPLTRTLLLPLDLVHFHSFVSFPHRTQSNPESQATDTVRNGPRPTHPHPTHPHQHQLDTSRQSRRPHALQRTFLTPLKYSTPSCLPLYSPIRPLDAALLDCYTLDTRTTRSFTLIQHALPRRFRSSVGRRQGAGHPALAHWLRGDCVSVIRADSPEHHTSPK